MLITLGITAAVFLFCLCFRYYDTEADRLFAPREYLYALFIRIPIWISGLWEGNLWHQRDILLSHVSSLDYDMSLSRLVITLMAFLAGAGLAAAGGIFQTIYKNPMASPNMLGATAGVQLGNILMVVLYSSEALALVKLRYQYCYLLTAACVAVVILLGRLSGDRRGNPSVLKMVMAGAILSQGLSAYTMYRMYTLSDEDLLVYQQIGMGTYINLKALSVTIFMIVMIASILPMFLLRYRFNVTGLDDAEARASGVNPSPYRIVGQICGVVMVTAAMIHCGTAGMLSMVVPYIVRGRVGSDFKKVFTYSIMYGGILMMLCRTISTVAYVRTPAGGAALDSSGLPIMMPTAFFVDICLTPLFLMILARQRRVFE